MFLYRGLCFTQSISKSTTIAAEEPIQFYLYYKHMAFAWLSPAGDASRGVWGEKRRKIFEILKGYIFCIYLDISVCTAFFLCCTKLPHL